MKFDPCPFCGKTDLDVMTKAFYNKLMKKHGRACVCISCKDCDLDLYEHTDGVTYEEKIELLAKKWNRRAK